MATPAPSEDSLARFNIGPAECRKMALASRYEKLSLTGDALTGAQNDLRAAKMYETFRLNKYVKQSEMEERRRMLLGEEHVRSEEEHRLAVTYQQLRKRALLSYQKEVTAAQWTQQQMLEADNKLIVDREKNVLLHRRREFEEKFGDFYEEGKMGASMPPGYGPDPPALLMTIDTGHGMTDVLEVYLDDDPTQLATAFCTKHGLGEDVVSVLARQIHEQIGHATIPKKTPVKGSPYKLRRGPEDPIPIISTGTQRIIQGGSVGGGNVFDRLYSGNSGRRNY